MVVLLDTAELPRRDRADRFVSALRDAAAPSEVALEDPGGDVHARLDRWTFGNAVVLRNESSGIRLSWTPRQARQGSPVVALAIQERGVGRHRQFGPCRTVRIGELLMTDRSAPFDYSWAGHGAARAVNLPVDQLGLPVDLIRRAATLLTTSPLYPLVTNHVSRLTRDADRLSRDPAAANLGTASIELARALLASAAHDEGHARAALADTLLTRIRAYVRQHLRDPELCPASIAAEHSISVRYLYKLCARADFSLEQWIIGQRLDGARQELVRPTGSRRSVAMIARRWGFRDPTHFSRRFRAAYGLTPRDWRRLTVDNP